MKEEQADRLVRCFVALNNIAVRLMELHCFDQASATLRDCVALTFRFMDLRPVGVASLNLVTEKACGRLSHPQRSTGMKLWIKVQVEDGTIGDMGKAVHVDHNGAGLYPIRLEKNDGDQVLDLDLPLLVSVASYNYAVSYLCQAKVNADFRQVRRYCNKAARTLTLASHYVPATSLSYGTPLRSLYLSISILHTSIHILVVSGRANLAALHVYRLAQLRVIAELVDAKNQFLYPTVERCAGAA